MDIAFPHNDIKGISHIESWESCAKLCENESKCFAWTFSKSQGSCFLKDENWKNGRKNLEGSISGTKNCSTTTTSTAITTAATTTTTTATTTTTTRGITGFFQPRLIF